MSRLPLTPATRLPGCPVVLALPHILVPTSTTVSQFLKINLTLSHVCVHTLLVPFPWRTLANAPSVQLGCMI